MYIDNRNGERKVLRDFLTLDEVVKIASDPNPKTDRDWSRLASKDNVPSGHWDLNLGYDAAVRMCVDGWQEKADELERMADRMSAEYEAMGHSWDFSDGGDDIEVGRFLEGEPEHWIEHQPTEAREITVKVGLSFNCEISGMSAFRRGAAIYAVVRALEKAGFSVAIVGIFGSRSNLSSGYYCNEIELKKAGEYLDPSRLAYFLAHPGFFRRVGLRLKECYGKEYNFLTSVTAKYGKSWSLKSLVEVEPGQVLIDNLSSENPSWRNSADAIFYIVNEFKRQGVEVRQIS